MEDSTENRGKFDLFYNLNRRTSFDLDYQVWARDYDKSTSDYTSHQFMANITRTYKKLSVTGGLGYHDRSFDEDGLEDIDAFAWRLAVNGQSGGDPDEMESGETPRSRMMFSLSQNLNDIGTGEQYYTATRLDAMVSRLFMEKLDASLQGYYQLSDYEKTDREDDTWKVTGAVKYLMKEWVTLGCETGYENRDSNVADKDYDNFHVMFNAEFNYNLGSR